VSVLLVVAAVFFYITAGFTMAKWGEVAKLVAGLVPVIAACWVLASSIGRFATLDSRRAAKTFVDNRSDPMEDLANHFQWVLAEAGRPVMLLIDDFDRCHVVEVLETIQKLLRDQSSDGVSVDRKPLHSLIILVAADGRWIRASYDNTYSNLANAVSEPGASIGSLFVQKLFQLAVPVPRLSDALKSQYITDLLSANSRGRKRAPKAASESLYRRIGAARSGEEILSVLEGVPQVERIKVPDRAIHRLVVSPAGRRTRRPSQYPPCARAVRCAGRSHSSVVEAIRDGLQHAPRRPDGRRFRHRCAAAGAMDCPRHAMAHAGDYLQRFPESVELFKSSDERKLKHVPTGLLSLFTDPPDELSRVVSHPAGPLDAEAIRSCSGQ
jgi:hypothetical protein